MSLPNPSLIISEVARLIEAQLLTYAEPRGGLVKILEGESHLWEEIYNGGLPCETPRIFIISLGEEARGEYAGGDRTDLCRVDRKWMVVVMRGHGFKNLAAVGQGQPETPGYVEPFSDSCETVRDGCRVMKNISEEFPVNYTGMRPLPNVSPTSLANVFMDARAITFETAADIPRILNGTTG